MSTSAKKTRPARARDAEATMKLIKDAAVTLLCEKGYTGLGVNALANAAGVDKQLIYYYFDGLDGVIRQLGADLHLWLGTPLEAREGETYAGASSRLLLEYTAALRKNPLVMKLLTWELEQPSAVLSELEQTRSLAMMNWLANMRARSALATPPPGIDAPAVNAILLAGLQYLALREQSAGSFAGLDVQSTEGQARIASAIAFITSKVYTAE